MIKLLDAMVFIEIFPLIHCPAHQDPPAPSTCILAALHLVLHVASPYCLEFIDTHLYPD